MSTKQEVKMVLLDRLFGNIIAGEGTELFEEKKRHMREVSFYISNSLNKCTYLREAINYLHPSLFNMLNLNFKQNLLCYESNPSDDSVVSSALAFKMLVGD